jgi:DNA-directed RNA polymerase subunit F
LERRLVGTKYISYAEAKAILYKRIQEAPSKDLIERTWEYLGDVGEGDAEKAAEVRERIVRELGIDEIIAANLVSICPRSPGEVRSILMSKETTKELAYNEDLVNKILEILGEFCPKEE